MKLYTYFRSSAAYRVRIALNLKGVTYTSVPVNLLLGEQHSAAYLQMNPQGLVPALVLDGGEVLNQSTAIVEWLEETLPAPALLPADALQRARVRGLCNQIACDIHPLNNSGVTNYLKQDMAASPEQVAAWYGHWITRGFSSIETIVARGNGRFCFGDRPGMADCYLIPQVYNARRFNVDLSDFPALCAVTDHCNTLPAFERAAPERQVDALAQRTKEWGR